MDLLILTLATYRLAQIVAQDVISEPLRAWVSKRGAAPEDLSLLRRWLSYLVHCVICVSVWAGLLLAALWYYLPVTHWLIYGLAASGGAVVLGSVLAATNRPRGVNHDPVLRQ